MSPSYLQVAGLITRIVSLTFGGGSAIVAALQREFVERRQWLTHEQFGICYAVSRITPGTNIFAFCTGAGWHFGKWRGALLSLLVASLPCSLFMVLALLLYDSARDNPWVAVALRGAMAAAIGVILASAWSILRPHLNPARRFRNLAIASTSAVLMIAAGLSPIPILFVAATVGFLFPDSSPTKRTLS